MAGFETERDRRVEAIRLVKVDGLTITDAARRVGRSRQWLSKWLRREAAGEGLDDRSRSSSGSFTPLSTETVDTVLAYRRRLDADPVASIGGLAILAEMEREGLTELPSIRSIERILTTHGVSQPRAKKRSRSTVPVLPLPQIPPIPGIWQQTDWVQDRYLKGGVRYNSIQLVDMGSHGGIARQYRRRFVANAVEFLVNRAWPIVSIPSAISIDNAFSKTSHRDNPWTSLIRTCLFFGVEPVISPPYELGWTNGVENFNNLWQDRTIAQHHYDTLEALADHTGQFNTWANHRRPVLEPAICGTRFPAVLIERHRIELRWPPDVFIADHQDRNGHLHIPLTAGRITFLRRVRNRHIHIAHTNWPIDLPDHTLTIASITTTDAALTIRHNAETIATHNYPIKHPITGPYHPPQTHSIYHHA